MTVRASAEQREEMLRAAFGADNVGSYVVVSVPGGMTHFVVVDGHKMRERAVCGHSIKRAVVVVSGTRIKEVDCRSCSRAIVENFSR